MISQFGTARLQAILAHFLAGWTGAVYQFPNRRRRDSPTPDRGRQIREHRPMTDPFTLPAPELAALLCSRVCHDIISPVGAINNGLELLDEGGADADAMNLIRVSARNASSRLQFARLAFGAAGSAGMLIDTGDAEVGGDCVPEKRKAGACVERPAGAAAQEQGQASAQLDPDRQCRHPARRPDDRHARRSRRRAPLYAGGQRPDGTGAAEIPRAALRRPGPKSRSMRMRCSPITRCCLPAKPR